MLTLPRILIGVIILLVLISAGGGYYLYTQYQKSQHELQLAKTDPATLQKAAQEEVKRLVGDVGKLIELPNGEEPTVATITDIEKLKNQPFFQKAKNGDKVLIYTNAKKAILYDPNAHKILDVAPVNIGSSSARESQAKIVVRNGTTTVGLTNKVEADLKKAFPELNVVAKDNAIKTDYEKTIVVALNDAAKDAAASLAKALNAQTADVLPGGENKPKDGDILILIGKDKIPATAAPAPTPGQ